MKRFYLLLSGWRPSTGVTAASTSVWPQTVWDLHRTSPPNSSSATGQRSASPGPGSSRLRATRSSSSVGWTASQPPPSTGRKTARSSRATITSTWLTLTRGQLPLSPLSGYGHLSRRKLFLIDFSFVRFMEFSRRTTAPTSVLQETPLAMTPRRWSC